MSHYTVAVIHKKEQEVADLLAPYDENLKVDRYHMYTRQEAVEEARRILRDGESMTDDECWQFMADDAGEGMTDEEGNIYSDYNPNSYWDWWQEGGRWPGMLKLKNGGTADSARIGAIDFSPCEEKYRHALRFWDVVVDHKEPEDGEDYFTIYKEEYFRDFYGDRETYARHQAGFSTYAVITPDGEWHAKGRMGWFASGSETPEEAKEWEDGYLERFIKSADPSDILTIVDCHI